MLTAVWPWVCFETCNRYKIFEKQSFKEDKYNVEQIRDIINSKIIE